MCERIGMVKGAVLKINLGGRQGNFYMSGQKFKKFKGEGIKTAS